MWIIAYGNIIDGMSFYGPFETSQAAHVYALEQFKEDLDWHIAKLHAGV
jgi:hypothetical protein